MSDDQADRGRASQDRASQDEASQDEASQDEASEDEAGQAAAGDADVSSAQAELEELRSRVSDAEDMRLRALADLDNLRKRCAAQVGRAAAEARVTVAAEWLPVVDNLDLALEHSQADPETIIEGVRSVRDQALRVLASLGYPRRDDVGAAFDPARHDAIAVHSEPGVAAGTVIDVLRPGYGDGEHQLRPAQVVVAKAE